jgi:cysteine desulfurase / selenocysteine lyase
MFNIKKVRSDFPILKRKIMGKKLVYLDSAATSQKPMQVIDSVVNYYKNHNANVHRGVHTLSDESTEMVENARNKIADFIGANSSEEVIFVRNASEGINLVMYSWARKNLKKGDVVVIGMQEHHSNIVPWQVLVKEKGLELRFVDVDSEGCLVDESLIKVLDKKVKLVGLTQVSNLLGVINNMEDVVKEIKKKSPMAKILVDGSQSVSHMKVVVKKMGVDFFAFSGHKMLGPTGIGVLWGKKDILEKMDPFIFGGDMISDVKVEGSKWNKLPYKFEAGTPNMAGAIGLGAAVEYLEKLGMDNVRNHEKKLVEYGLRKLEELEKKGVIEIYGPRDSEVKGGVLTFNIKGVHAHDAAQILDSFGIAVRSGFHCAQPLAEKLKMGAAVRASFYIYNTKEEVDFLVEKILEVLKVFKIR